MSLAENFVRFAEYHYAIDWMGLQDRVASRLPALPSLGASVCDPLQHPTYWCLPILVGHYVGASRQAVLADTEAFVAACLMRHFAFDAASAFERSPASALFRIIRRAYDESLVSARDGAGTSFGDRFARKCAPWLATIAFGAHTIERECGHDSAYTGALQAIVQTYSCVQIIDDWNDRAEDVSRAQWNMWVNEPVAYVLPVMEPLLQAAIDGLASLKPHFLKRALAAQVADTQVEIAKLLNDLVGTHHAVCGA